MSLETDLHKNNQLIFDKGVKAIQWSKKSLSKNGDGTNGHTYAKNINLDLTLFTQYNSKWITDLNVKHKTINWKTTWEKILVTLGMVISFKIEQQRHDP